jgi:hypothetical protein
MSDAYQPGDVCMVYDDHGNAFHCFDYTPEALEEEAERLREANGEVTWWHVDPSPFLLERGRTA